jgi:DNA modification methylase
MDLRLGDCLDVMRCLPDASVDLVFADLPYGVTRNKWDSLIPFTPLWAELLRLGKSHCAYIFTASQPFATAMVNSNINMFRYDLIWQKHSITGFLNASRQPLRVHESILIFFINQPTYNPQKTQGSRPYKKIIRSGHDFSNNYGIQSSSSTYNIGIEKDPAYFAICQQRISDKQKSASVMSAIPRKAIREPVALPKIARGNRPA